MFLDLRLGFWTVDFWDHLLEVVCIQSCHNSQPDELHLFEVPRIDQPPIDNQIVF